MPPKDWWHRAQEGRGAPHGGQPLGTQGPGQSTREPVCAQVIPGLGDKTPLTEMSEAGGWRLWPQVWTVYLL